MFILPAFRRRLARVVALLGPSAPQPPALRADIGHPTATRRIRASDLCLRRTRPGARSTSSGTTPGALFRPGSPRWCTAREQTWIPVVDGLFRYRP
ncbi:SsgA family sporulation/cell division regulator [Streptomyces californicus]